MDREHFMRSIQAQRKQGKHTRAVARDFGVNLSWVAHLMRAPNTKSIIPVARRFVLALILLGLWLSVSGIPANVTYGGAFEIAYGDVQRPRLSKATFD